MVCSNWLNAVVNSLPYIHYIANVLYVLYCDVLMYLQLNGEACKLKINCNWERNTYSYIRVQTIKTITLKEINWAEHEYTNMCSSIIEFAVHQLKVLPIHCLQLHVVIQFAVCGMFIMKQTSLFQHWAHTRVVIKISCICRST